jgi:copper chaperone CopZ
MLKVSGMTCAGCEAAVKIAARSIDGVTDVKASYAKKNAEVTYDPAKTSPEMIAKVITEKSGFKAEAIQQPAKK